MNVNIIPLKNNYSNYFFNIILDGNKYDFFIKWNNFQKKWFVDIIGVTNNLKIYSIALVTGINLLEPYGKNFIGKLFLADVQGKKSEPTFFSLGNQHKLIYILVD